MEIVLNKQTFNLERFKLRKWLEIEEVHSDAIQAAEIGNGNQFTDCIHSYISAAVSIPTEELEDTSWIDIYTAYMSIYSVNLPSKPFPVLKGSSDGEKAAWDYIGRDWYIWANLLAKTYGWEMEYMADMDIDDAIAMSQEVLVGDQLSKEWEYGISGVGVNYDKTGKGTFKPLGRPGWMMPEIVVEKTKILKSMMPVGNVVTWNKNEKNIEPSRSSTVVRGVETTSS